MTVKTSDALPAAPTRPPNTRRFVLSWIALITRPLRHALRVSRWPVQWRALLGRASAEELTALERAKQAAAEEQAVVRRLNELAGEYKRLLINALTRVGASKVINQDGKQIIRPVRFHKPAHVTREAIYFQVDTAHLPHRVKLSDLYDPENVETLMAACNRVVQAVWDREAPEKGFWYVVELKAGVRGIPRFVEYASMLNKMPKAASRYTVPVGLGVAGKPTFLDFVDTPHLLIAGATGQGKTVCIEQIILSLAMQSSAAQLQFWIVDLKDGVDLGLFKGLPHLIGKVTTDVEDVVPILVAAKREIKRRQKMFEENGVVNIEGWNQRKRRKLPRMFLVIDELAELMLSEEKKEAERLLARIAAIGRSAGVHAIIATQRPESSIVTGLIKANFTTRLAFACADVTASKVVLDTGDAAGLKPLGRLIYMRGADKTELQSPYVSPKIIGETVALLTQGKPADALATRRRHNFSPEDFFHHALERYPGRFPIRPIYEDLKMHGVTESELRELALRYEGTEFEVGGDIYTLTGAVTNGVKESRQLIKVLTRNTDAGEGDEDDAVPIPDDALAGFQPIEVSSKSQMRTMHDADETGEEPDPPGGD